LTTDDRRRLEQALLLGAQPIDASGQDSLHRGGHANARERAREVKSAPPPHHHLRLNEGARALLEEEGIALRPLDEQRLERKQVGSVTEQRAEKRLGALGSQRIEAYLPVVRLVGPAVTVL